MEENIQKQQQFVAPLTAQIFGSIAERQLPQGSPLTQEEATKRLAIMSQLYASGTISAATYLKQVNFLDSLVINEIIGERVTAVIADSMMESIGREVELQSQMKPHIVKCPECNGTGEYRGVRFVEKCRKCRGSKKVRG